MPEEPSIEPPLPSISSHLWDVHEQPNDEVSPPGRERKAQDQGRSRPAVVVEAEPEAPKLAEEDFRAVEKEVRALVTQAAKQTVRQYVEGFEPGQLLAVPAEHLESFRRVASEQGTALIDRVTYLLPRPPKDFDAVDFAYSLLIQYEDSLNECFREALEAGFRAAAERHGLGMEVRQAPKRGEGKTRERAFDQLREALDLVKSQTQGDTAFAGKLVELLEGTLGELRGSTAEPHPLAEKELPTGAGPHEPMMSAQETIERLKELREPDAIQAFLDRFVVGRAWDSLKENQEIAYGITRHLRSLQLRLKCLKDGEPSYLRAVAIPGIEKGAWYFEHYTDKRQQRHGASSSVPKLEVIPEGPDRRRKNR
jgi:hypothetical protein